MTPKRLESSRALVVGRIAGSILLIRNQRVILDADLAELYGVSTKRLNEAVKRNPDRFPSDFVVRLSDLEFARLRSQIATSKGRGGRRHLPFAFTEHGAIMAANVLNSPKAIRVGVYVVRAFVKLRELLSTQTQLAVKLDELERKLEKHDGQIIGLIQAIRQLMDLSEREDERPRIGYQTEERGKRP